MSLKKLSLLNPYHNLNPYIQNVMKLKDRLLLMLASLALGWLLVDAKPIVIGSKS